VFDRVPNVPDDPEAYTQKPVNRLMLQELITKYDIRLDQVEKELEHVIKYGKPMEGDGYDVFGYPVEGAETPEVNNNSFGADPFKANIINLP
jgi:hypothetical protein